ncbi:helix-turn-helix transcriptional regulator [Streptomyces sp. S07_1.15]|uniref:helix-turn-helix domain-containing protein n=1 Tax=Streptomyces sp. S07_1.15 TaxID=2873925 RepID=UPI001D14B608|nr:helix-turn-helix transcriptional regulator [Streptomyces sp. S07_1.15]MCC3653214.1 helix-turn-helix transcriptional regulator [Streptomyces sp. S07_1.15]
MTTGRIELGPTGRTVAANVKRLREGRGLTLRALSKALREKGRPLSADALNKIENGASEEPRPIRRVDADDLVALAVALDVHPAALLLPHTAASDQTAIITTAGEVPARRAWEWAHGMRPLREDQDRGWLRFRLNALPEAWRAISARQYAEWSAHQAKKEYEHILEQTGFNPDGTRREGGDDG